MTWNNQRYVVSENVPRYNDLAISCAIKTQIVLISDYFLLESTDSEFVILCFVQIIVL